MPAKIKQYRLVSRVFKFYRPYTAKIALLLGCIITSTGINMLTPYIAKLLMDEGLIKMNYGYTVKLAILNIFLLLFGQFISMAETKYMVYINAMAAFSMSKAALKQLLRIRIQFFDNANFSMIMNNIDRDIENINKICDDGSLYGVAQVLGFIGGLIGLVLIDWRLTLIVLLTLPIRYGVVRRMTGIRREYTKKQIKIYGDYSSWYGDIIGGIREIRLWGIDGKIRSYFIKKQREIINIEIKSAVLNSLNNASQTALHHILTNALYITGAYFIVGKTMTIGTLFAFITYSTYVTHPVNVLFNIWYSLSGIIPSAKRFFEFLDMQREGETLSEKPAEAKENVAEGNIRFENVSFSYEEGNRILNNINMEIKKGERIAIIGVNGAGKSTIANLLLRMYLPDSGRILMGGVDINNIRLKEYRNMISVVNQDTYLFNTTVKDNITLFGDQDYLKIYKAAKASCAHDFIERMPDKYESIVGRDGAKLSGGQRQKIAVARAFLKDSAMLILDEATSNCDVESEMQINSIIKSNTRDKTIIMITHRFNMLQNMDRILLLENGYIREIGTYKDLVSGRDFYNAIFDQEEAIGNSVL